MTIKAGQRMWEDKQLGENIARLRKAQKLSQTELAEAMRTAGHDWHQNTVSRIENGHQLLNLRELEDLENLVGDVLHGTRLGKSLESFSQLVLEDFAEHQLSQAEAALATATKSLEMLRRALATRQKHNRTKDGTNQ